MDGPKALWVGEGDLHDPARNKYKFSVEIADFAEYSGQVHPSANGTTYDERFDDTSTGHCKVRITFSRED